MRIIAHWRSDLVNIVTSKEFKMLHREVRVWELNRESRLELKQQMDRVLSTKTRSDCIIASSVAQTKTEQPVTLVCRMQIQTLQTSQPIVDLRYARTTGARLSANVTLMALTQTGINFRVQLTSGELH